MRHSLEAGGGDGEGEGDFAAEDVRRGGGLRDIDEDTGAEAVLGESGGVFADSELVGGARVVEL